MTSTRSPRKLTRRLFPEMEPLYTQVIDGARRAAVDRVGSVAGWLPGFPAHTQLVFDTHDILDTARDLEGALFFGLTAHRAR